MPTTVFKHKDYVTNTISKQCLSSYSAYQEASYIVVPTDHQVVITMELHLLTMLCTGTNYYRAVTTITIFQQSGNNKYRLASSQ